MADWTDLRASLQQALHACTAALHLQGNVPAVPLGKTGPATATKRYDGSVKSS